LLLPAALAAAATLPPGPLPLAWERGLAVAATALGVLPVLAFLALGQVLAGTRARRIPAGVGHALLLAAGLAPTHAAAVARGLGPGTGAWERTPKTGDGGVTRAARRYPVARSTGAGTVAALAVAAGAIAVAEARAGRWLAVPFLACLAAGAAAVGVTA